MLILSLIRLYTIQPLHIKKYQIGSISRGLYSPGSHNNNLGKYQATLNINLTVESYLMDLRSIFAAAALEGQMHNKCPMTVRELSNASQMSVTWPHGIDCVSSRSLIVYRWSPITDHRPLIVDLWSMYADRWMLEAEQTLDMAICDWSDVDLDFQATISKMS